MIIGSCGRTTMAGGISELLADFAAICEALEETLIENGFSENEARKSIEEAVALSRLSVDELDEKVKEKTDELLNALRKELSGNDVQD